MSFDLKQEFNKYGVQTFDEDEVAFDFGAAKEMYDRFFADPVFLEAWEGIMLSFYEHHVTDHLELFFPVNSEDRESMRGAIELYPHEWERVIKYASRTLFSFCIGMSILKPVGGHADKELIGCAAYNEWLFPTIFASWASFELFYSHSKIGEELKQLNEENVKFHDNKDLISGAEGAKYVGDNLKMGERLTHHIKAFTTMQLTILTASLGNAYPEFGRLMKEHKNDK
ncbi:MAG: hypothetical protein KKH61_21460 [Gammaproteobacteria bacterium]|uniref:Uncharacterized protein n=1 Tax=viral metagenome TaxID=1070528 RepID=A0A6H1ZAR0_9ZZZZ|nr:hypothetical protein [Gammaproteobacteria bacterium]